MNKNTESKSENHTLKNDIFLIYLNSKQWTIFDNDEREIVNKAKSNQTANSKTTTKISNATQERTVILFARHFLDIHVDWKWSSSFKDWWLLVTSIMQSHSLGNLVFMFVYYLFIYFKSYIWKISLIFIIVENKTTNQKTR